mmetsp:Transcript_76968/g.218111  ORF Transcript_76968/g.218111 Transcript_76968/m.218111 type:complete len:316 (+) Transcript_76968:2138-3085(+)
MLSVLPPSPAFGEQMSQRTKIFTSAPGSLALQANRRTPGFDASGSQLPLLGSMKLSSRAQSFTLELAMTSGRSTCLPPASSMRSPISLMGLGDTGRLDTPFSRGQIALVSMFGLRPMLKPSPKPKSPRSEGFSGGSDCARSPTWPPLFEGKHTRWSCSTDHKFISFRPLSKIPGTLSQYPSFDSRKTLRLPLSRMTSAPSSIGGISGATSSEVAFSPPSPSPSASFSTSPSASSSTSASASAPSASAEVSFTRDTWSWTFGSCCSWRSSDATRPSASRSTVSPRSARSASLRPTTRRARAPLFCLLAGGRTTFRT